MRARRREPVVRSLGALLAIAALASSPLASSPLTAQTTAGACTITPASLTTTSGADACRKAQDLFAFVIPQMGVALAGGNPVLGEGGTMGGWGKRALSIRVTAVDGRLPKNDVPIRVNGGAVASDFGATAVPVPSASADLALGFFKGIPLGLTNVGGVDLLVGAMYIPTVTKFGVSLAPSGASRAFSYGARVGLLQESAVVPGISVSYLRRKMPTLDLSYSATNDTLGVRNLALTANSTRLTVSKRLLFLGLAAGVGQDEIEGTAGLNATINEPVGSVSQRYAVGLQGLRTLVKRNTAFVNASMSLVVLRVVGEYGWSSAGTLQETVNQFGGRAANEGYRYASVGLSMRF